MGHKIGDRIKETASSSGLADFTLAGAVANFDPFSNMPGGWSTGDTTWYCAHNGAQWEIGVGTKSGTFTLARSSILRSTNGGAKVNFSAPPEVFCTAPASEINVGKVAFSTVSTSNQTAGSSLYKVLFQSEEFDVGGSFDLPNSRFVAPADGTYHFLATLWFNPALTVSPLITLFKNGTAQMHMGQPESGVVRANASGVLALLAGDVVELYMNFNNAGGFTIGNGSRFQGFRVH